MKKPTTKKMFSNEEQTRQGDVLLMPIDKIPKGLKRGKDLVLAYGETTGHKHEFLLDKAEFYPVETEDNPFITGYLKVDEPIDLLHEDHEGYTVLPGKYQVRLPCQVEVDQEDQEIFKRILD